MKLRLLRDSRITHKSGEIVEVSPAEAYFLLSVGSAEPVAENVPIPEAITDRAKRERPRKTAK